MKHTKREMLEGCLKQTMELAQHAKKSMCIDSAGKSDHDPMLIVGITAVDEDGEERIGGAVISMELENNQHPVNEMPKMLSETHKKGLQEFHWLIMITEGYARRYETEEEIKKAEVPERGELAKEFAENANSNVAEGIILTMYSWTGESLTNTCFYKYDDKCVPVYEESEIAYYEAGDQPPRGRIPEMFMLYIKYCHLYQDFLTGIEKIKSVSNEHAEGVMSIMSIDDLLDVDDLPSFHTVWQVVLDDLPNKTKSQNAKHEKVSDFFQQTFTLKVINECWEAISEKATSGALDMDLFMKEMTETMEGDDNDKKREFVKNLTSKYSISAKALMMTMGFTEVPNDISGLVS